MSESHRYTGLTDAEVMASREACGSNILTPAKRTPLWKLFMAKFSDPLIIILLVVGALSVGISFYEHLVLGQGVSVFFEPIGIFVAILLATGLSFWFEMKADREFALLNQVNDDEPVQVIRNGGMRTAVPRRDVVTGDIVVVGTGDEIPADGDLLEAISLSVDESTLTGEPICHKTVNQAEFDPHATFPSDRVLRGTKVMEGHGLMRVTAVGDATENGKVFTAAQIDNSVKTPLNEQLDRLGRMISVASYVIGALVVAGRIIMYFIHAGGDWQWMDFVSYMLQTVMIAVTLVVVSVPEGLPMAVTLSLAYSMRRMLRTNNLVRRMHACETMGATTVICTDKTGTLTQNRMQVHEARFYGLRSGLSDDNAATRAVVEGIAVNSTAQLDLTDPDHPKVLGNPTEGALLLWLRDGGVDWQAIRGSVKVVAELPFTTERKYMATVVENSDGERILYVKGAPEIVLGMCPRVTGNVDRGAISEQLAEYQAKAMRTLGFAFRRLAVGEECPISDGKLASPGDLEFLGIVAIADPVRGDVPAAVRECVDAGIAVKIVTGDTPGTAKEIGRQIGLWTAGDGDEAIITGPEFDALTDAQLAERVGQLKIIARARPMDKKRLVEALQSRGDVVAVTGDGTNDAPALKAAHVGLSMGDGTSVAKEASDITIVDNSFASICRAVMWGRSLYRNIQRFILFQLTVNVAACMIVLAGAFMGTESPLTVTQMLWVNLIMDTFAAMALASLPPSEEVMRDKPRDRREFIITRTMWRDIIGTGVTFFVALLAVLFFFEHSTVTSTSDFLHLHIGPRQSLSVYELSLFFTFFVMLQFWNMFNARAFGTGHSAFRLRGCSGFIAIAAAILVGQVLIVSFGGAFFSVTPLSLADWLWVTGITSVVLWIGEESRALGRRR